MIIYAIPDWIMRRFLSLIASCLMVAVTGNSNAQVTPDGSLPNNSVVSDELEITGGTTAGSNLFHSFTEFSVDTGQTAYFNNDLAIDNIISRITGSSISDIDGLLRANGTANLFLINPNGIIFGENAALDIGGSFVGSTADLLQFADGSEFSTVDSDALLTISIPIGLQYGNSPGDITVRGAGNNLSIDFDTFTVDRSDRPVGLEVTDGNTLALLGGNVFLPGGNLTAREGRVAIGSIGSNGLVRLDPNTLGWSINYDEVDDFQNIALSEAASIEVSGNSGGEVRLQGQNISIVDGSAILADTLGSGAGRALEISAIESIEIVGFAADNYFPTRLSTDVDLDATGDGGNLVIDTDYLAITQGAQVNSGTFGLGNAGNLTVVASDIEVIGESEFGEFVSGLFAQADIGDTGNGGNINIDTSSLFVGEGAEISTTTFGSGNAGSLNIRANTVEIEGFSEPSARSSSLSVTTEGEGNGGNLTLTTDLLSISRGAEISTTTFFGSGNAGNLNIQADTIELQGGASAVGASGLFANADEESLGDGGNLNIETNSLSIVDGAQIQALTFSVGKAGTITIDAGKINLAGTSPTGNPSGISAAAALSDGIGGNIEITTNSLEVTQGAQIATSTSGLGNGGDLNVVARDFVRLSGASDGKSSGLFANALENDGAGGDLTVRTDFLSVLDGATINVGNFSSNDTSTPGEGAAGNLTIVASEILLDEATITADTLAGDLGNLNFQTDLLILRRGSKITTDAQRTATGGNITINAEDGFLVAFPQENSDITANAVLGDGGRVDIEALEIFGIEPRASLTPKSDITTSSEFGIAGNVILQTQDLNPAEDLTKLPDAPNPPEIATGCQEIQASDSSFVNLGQGGLNPQPDAALGSDSQELMGDVQLPRQWSLEPKDDANADLDSSSVVEAEAWIVNQQGKIELVADMTTRSPLFNCQLN